MQHILHEKTINGIFAHFVKEHYGLDLIGFNKICILAQDENRLAHFIYHPDRYRLMTVCVHTLGNMPEPYKSGFESLLKQTNCLLSPVENHQQTLIKL